jgi:molybdenum cofactor biosynthesis enzyme MoaA
MIDLKTNTSFCPAAWNSIYVEPGGRIRNCCVAKDDLGTVYQDVDQVVHNQKSIEIRQQMLDGQIVPSCHCCGPDSQFSLRDTFTEKYFVQENQDLFADVNNFKLQYLDLRWHNTCNFACVYCGPGVSSSWALELGRPNRMDREHIQNLENYILKNLDHVNHVYLAGGEPLLMKENARLLEKIYEINPNARINVNSNISHANKDNEVYRWLTRFPNTFWIISAEARAERFNYIRYPGNWDEFKKNLDQIRRDFDFKQIGFNLVLCTLNAIEIWKFIDWLIDQKFKPCQISIVMSYQAVDPSLGLDCRNFSEALVEDIKRLAREPRYDEITNIQGVRDALERPVEINQDLLVDFLDEIDRRRGLNSREIFPEIYNYINEPTIHRYPEIKIIEN